LSPVTRSGTSARGQHDDRGRAAALAETLADGEAIEIGEHHIQDDQRRLFLAGDAHLKTLVAQPDA